MKTLCNEINEALEPKNESAKGFKKEFPELHKVIMKDDGADIIANTEVVKKVPTKAGDVYVVETSGHSHYFSLKHGWVGEEDEGLDHEDFEKHQSEFDKNKKKAEVTRITEAQHYNTKMRGIEEKMGSRRIRMGLKEYNKMIKNMMDKKHPSPNPVSEKDMCLLKEACTLLEQCIPRLKDVKETRRKGK